MVSMPLVGCLVGRHSATVFTSVLLKK